MEPRIEILNEKKLVGKRIQMNLANDKTRELWQGFLPRRHEINHKLNTDFYSIQVYEKTLKFEDFDPNTQFEKWAAIEVSSFEEVPNEMETFVLTAGVYAVFIHKGLPGDFPKTAQYIFGIWLPNSKFQEDSRPHFEVLHENYRPDDPEAEEEVWIPVKVRD